MSRGLRHIVSFLAVLGIVAVPYGVTIAQTDPADTRAHVEAHIAEIDHMLDSVASLPEWDHDALNFRIDERIVDLHETLATIDVEPETAETADTPPADGSITRAVLRGWWNRAIDLSAIRTIALAERIEIEFATYDEFADTTDSIISRAFVQDLRRVRLQHLKAILDALDRRADLAFQNAAEIRAQLEASIDLTANRLVGQIRLDAMTLEELRRSAASDPGDATLRTALRAVERKQSSSLDALNSVIELQSKLGANTAELRALLADQRGTIGAEILDSGVFMRIIDERLQLLKDGILVNGPVLVVRLIVFLLILLVAFLVARAVRAGVRYVTSRQSVELGDLRERTLESISWAIVILAGTVSALSALGVSLGPMLAGLGVAGIIVGLALQESLGNLAAGGMILATRPFDLHDIVRIGSAEGKVKDMTLVATTIAGYDNTIQIIPNREVWSSTITNFTRAKVRRVDVEVSVPYDADLAGVERLLREVVDGDDRVRETPAPQIHFGDRGESAITFWVRAWVNTPDHSAVSTALKRRISEQLRDAGIDAPQQRVRMTVEGSTAEALASAQSTTRDA